MANTNNEKIIEKIKKVLELSKNNPSPEEAQSAALKAQKLMVEYHISLKEVEAVEDVDEITETQVIVGTGNKWKYQLARIIAKNFRCRHFYYGKSIIVFYGHETDTEIAAMTFETLYKVGNKGANNFYQNKRNEAYRNGELYWFNGKGLKNQFLIGYLEGIKSVLDKQCTALMIVTPKEVNESYEKMVETWDMKRSINTGLRYTRNDEARQRGYETGRNAVENRRLAAATA